MERDCNLTELHSLDSDDIFSIASYLPSPTEASPDECKKLFLDQADSLLRVMSNLPELIKKYKEQKKLDKNKANIELQSHLSKLTQASENLGQSYLLTRHKLDHPREALVSSSRSSEQPSSWYYVPD